MTMRTDDLVKTLAADHAIRPPSIGRVLALALVVGLAIAAAIFAVMLGPRPDAVASLSSPRFVLKFVETLLLAGTAGLLTLRLMRPDAAPGAAAVALVAAPAVLVLAVLAELMLVPADAWAMRLTGKNSLVCLTFIPLMAVPLLAALFVALRHGAPTRPVMAGAAAGLLAGGLSATLYAAHCIDDSPLFVATWYGLAIAVVATIGALLGSRLLRW
jgi:hypothetical protein